MRFKFNLGTGMNSGDTSIDEVRLSQLEKNVSSNKQRIQELENQIKIVVTTQEDYDALETPDETMLHVIIDNSES